nr:hypothetical protein CFP56_73193 [Quercus suber]
MKTLSVTPMVLALLFSVAQANTRHADPGLVNDTLCTFDVFSLLPKSNLLNNTLLIWPAGSCCTTIDCTLQDFTCATNPVHNGTGGDVCCYKATGDGAKAGMCQCGLDKFPQGTCF